MTNDRPSRVQLSKKVVMINSASSGITLLLNLAVLVWLQRYLIERIPTDEYALLALVMAVMMFVPLFRGVLTSGLGRFVTIAYAKGDDDEITRIVSTMFPICLGAGVLICVAGGAIALNIDSVLEINPDRVSEAKIMMALLVMPVGLSLALAPFASGFMVRQRLVIADLISLTSQVLRLGVLFTLLFGVSVSVLWVVVAQVASELFQIIVSTPISLRLVPAQRVRWNSMRWSTAREIVSYGWWSIFLELAEALRVAMDPAVLNRFVQPDNAAKALAVSSFHLGGLAPRQLALLSGPLLKPLIPILAQLTATDQIAKMRSIYFRASRYTTWVTLFFGIPVIILGPELMTLYLDHGRVDKEFIEVAGIVVSVLTGALVLWNLHSPAYALAAAAGEIRTLALRAITLQAANLLLTLWFVVSLGMGAIGSALATLSVNAVFVPLLIGRCAWRILGATFGDWVREALVPTMLPAVLAAGLCLALKVLFHVETWITLFAFSGLTGIFFLLVVLRFFLRPEDTSDLKRAAERVPTRFLRDWVKKLLRRQSR